MADWNRTDCFLKLFLLFKVSGCAGEDPCSVVLLSSASQATGPSSLKYYSSCLAIKTSSCLPSVQDSRPACSEGEGWSGRCLHSCKEQYFQLSFCGRRRQTSLADVRPTHTFPWQTSAAPPRDSRSHGVTTTATSAESSYFWVCFCGRRWKTFMEDVHPSHTIPWKT